MNFSQNEIRESDQAKLMDSSTTPERISDLLQSYMLPLDGYRGLAILLVFISHCEPINGADHTILIDDFYKTVLSYGSFGVDAFFVLSGFLITGILLDKQDRTNFFINFYLRRSLRILPPYYLFLIVFFLILTPVLGKYEFYQHLYSAQIWYWLYLDNFWLVRQLLQQYSFPSYILAYLSHVFLAGVLTLPICLFSWYFFEQPILRLKSYLKFDISIHNKS